MKISDINLKRVRRVGGILFLSLMMTSQAGQAAAEEGAAELIARGDDFYMKRQEGHKEEWAATGPIGKALEAYYAAYEKGDRSTELAVKILQSTYFYATYAEQDEKRQKAALQRAIDVGEEALKTTPNDAALNYQLGGCWGRWGEVNGIMASARKGVADRVREHAEKTVKADPDLADAGGYRTLGRLNFLAPRIPFILSWPSNEKSLEYLAKAVELGPDNLTNHLFYGETLLKEKQYAEGEKHLQVVLDGQMKDERAVEILRDKRDARALMEKYVTKVAAKK